MSLFLGVTALASAAPAPAPAQSASRSQNYTFAFRDADVALVAEEVLGRALGISYTVDPAVAAKVSFRVEQRLTPTGLLQALETALSTNGIVLIRDGNNVLLTTREKAKATGGVGASGRGSQPGQAGYRIVPADIGSGVPSEVAKALSAMGSGETVVLADDKAGVLMLGGTAREVDAANKAIAALGQGRAGASLSRWVELKNASATTVSAELAEVLQAANIRNVEVATLQRLNGLMLFGRSEQTLDEAARWVARLDVASADRDASLWVYRPKNVAAESLSDTLNDLLGGGVTSSRQSSSSTPAALGGLALTAQGPSSAPPRPTRTERTSVATAPGAGDGEVRFAVDRDSNSLLIFSPPSRRPQLERLLAQIDVTPRQILIEATVLEVTLSDEFRFGVDWSYLRDNGQVRVSSSGESNGAVAPAFPGFAITYLGTNVRAAIDALGSRTNVEVVSAPKIVSLDNRPARLQIGDQVPIAIEASQSTVTEDAPRVVSIEYRNTGIILEVTPRITGEDSVTLLVAQEVSSVARTTTSGIDSPTIQQRRFDSSLLLKSGGTVALGGLISTSSSRGDVGVPLLSQLPGVGYLFKTDGREKRRTELIVLLTARILPDAAASSATATDLSAGMREMQGRGLIAPSP